MEQEDQTKIEIDLNQAIEQNRDDPVTLINLGLSHMKSAEWELAEQDFERAIDLEGEHPKAPTAYASRGFCRMKLAEQGRAKWADAVEDLEQARKLGFKHPLLDDFLEECAEKANSDASR